MQGPVLQAFAYDEAHPYASGQHRGIDIGADAAGEAVVAPAAGTVTFAGTVPTSGKSVTIETADGYSVTLTHLGSILVGKGAAVVERDTIGTIGPSGTAEVEGPYVHLGIRRASDPNGYVDPLGFLPSISTGSATESDSAGSQPSSSGSSSAASGSAPTASTTASPASGPASSEPASQPSSTTRASTGSHARTGRSNQVRDRVRAPLSDARPSRSSRRSEAQPAEEASARTVRPTAARGRAGGQPTRSLRRPVVETAAPVEPTGLDAGHETRSDASDTLLSPSRLAPTAFLPLVLNGAAAIVAIVAAFAAARGRRRRRGACTTAAAPVLHLPRRETERQQMSRAA